MIYTYVCPQGHEVDARGGVADVSRPCECGKAARRREFYLPAIVGATVMKEQKYRVSEFQEAAMEVDYAYTKAESDGMPVKRPDLWGAAKKKAKAQGVQLR